MTNSHSRPSKSNFNKSSYNGNVSIASNGSTTSSTGGGLLNNSRHYNNSSPNNKKNSSFFANNSFNNCNNNQRGQQKSPKTVLVTSNPINILQTTPTKYNNYSFNNNNYCVSPNNNNRSQRSSPPMMAGSPPRMGSCSPPNPNYFAGSKCFDAPKPDELPKPPTSWMAFETKSCASEYASKQNMQSKLHMIPMQA